MKRINEYTQTSAMAMDVLAKSMQGKVYNFAAGDPDLNVCDALKQSFMNTDLDATHRYGSSQGNAELRAKLWKRPDEVIIANGAKQLMYMSIAAVTRPGDKVVLIGPCWTSYIQICRILGLDHKLLTGKADDNFTPDIEDVVNSIDDDTAAVIINSPNNPTGVIYSNEYMDKLLERVKEKNCWLISDEIYKQLSDKKFRSLRGDENVITIDGFSKSYNITGWRLGYSIAVPEVIKAMTALQSQMSGPPSTLIQSIVLDAFDGLKAAEFNEYKKRIEILCDIEKFAKHKPDGGFYFYLPIDDSWKNSKELCEYMLQEHRIVLTPGDDYGVERTVRLSVAAIGADDLTAVREYLKKI